jgi:hypothetical protein
MAPRRVEVNRGPNDPPPGVTWDIFQEICKTLERTGGKYKACESHGCKYNTVVAAIAEQEQAGDAEWKELWDLSYAKFRESLALEARSRAVDGWDEPVFYKGEEVGYIPRKSDRLLELMLKAHLPEYRDKLELSGGVQVQEIDVFSQLTLDAKRKIRAIMVQDLREQAERQALLPAPGDGEVVDAEFSEVDLTPDGLAPEDEPDA